MEALQLNEAFFGSLWYQNVWHIQRSVLGMVGIDTGKTVKKSIRQIRAKKGGDSEITAMWKPTF